MTYRSAKLDVFKLLPEVGQVFWYQPKNRTKVMIVVYEVRWPDIKAYRRHTMNEFYAFRFQAWWSEQTARKLWLPGRHEIEIATRLSGPTCIQ